MGKVTGGSLVAQVLKNDGIEHLFGIVGGHVYPIFEGCAEKGIRVIDVRHEESAAHMAEGWALATGKPGVCIGTAGPGFTNTLTGIANSFLGSTPLLAIGGRASISEFDTGALQDFNQLDIVKPMTKFARAVYETERIPEYVGMALRQATSGRPGPAYIEIPMDLVWAEIDESSLQIPECHRVQSRPAGNPQDVERAIELAPTSLETVRPVAQRPHRAGTDANRLPTRPHLISASVALGRDTADRHRDRPEGASFDAILATRALARLDRHEAVRLPCDGVDRACVDARGLGAVKAVHDPTGQPRRRIRSRLVAFDPEPVWPIRQAGAIHTRDPTGVAAGAPREVDSEGRLAHAGLLTATQTE